MIKTKYMKVEGNLEDLDLQDGTSITACEDYQVSGVKITKNCTREKEIRERINKGRKAIETLNSVPWSKQITKERKYLNTTHSNHIVVTKNAKPMLEKKNFAYIIK